MIVTQITGITKGRFRIYIEEKPAFVLYRGEVRRLGIREGEPLSEESLREKLRNGDYPESCIEEAVAYVKSYGYVDDCRYAGDFITYNLDRKSRTRMEQDLMRKGISKDTIRTVFEELEEQGTSQDEGAMIRRLLEKKKYDPQTATGQEKQRMYAFLYRRGFRAEVISRALLLDIT